MRCPCRHRPTTPMGSLVPSSGHSTRESWARTSTRMPRSKLSEYEYLGTLHSRVGSYLSARLRPKESEPATTATAANSALIVFLCATYTQDSTKSHVQSEQLGSQQGYLALCDMALCRGLKHERCIPIAVAWTMRTRDRSPPLPGSCIALPRAAPHRATRGRQERGSGGCTPPKKAAFI